MKKRLIVLLLLLFPISVFAYSDSLIVGGETIGIEVHSSGVYVVGFYSVNGENIGKNSGIEVGDIIKKVNDIEIHNIDELNDVLMDSNQFQLMIQRGRNLVDLNLDPVYENNILKTGLYVKDQINGLGTLSYIDPNTKIFGSLGHEIIESSSFSKFQINSGNIYKAEVSSINKSVSGSAGSKNAVIEKNTVIGDIEKNEEEGIFGFYTDDIPEQRLTPVGDIFDIHKGKAFIRTNILDDKIENFSINIISIDEVLDVHHIHIRSIDGFRNYATMHVVFEGKLPEVKAKVKEELAEHGIEHTTIEFEEKDEACDCKECEIKGECGTCDHHHHHHHHH